MLTEPANFTPFDFNCNQKQCLAFKEDGFLEQLHSQPILPVAPPVNLDELVKIGCDYFSIDESVLKSSSRNRINNKIRTTLAILSIEMHDPVFLSRYFNRNQSGL